jgi:D-glycero-alpha-D-manno-heptose-7-phosphate kinase
MILTKTPLRISFVGGGSDRPSFYLEEPGACVAASIDRYVYVAVNEQFEGRVLAHYRATEDVPHVNDLRHDRMRACLKSFGIERGIEITSMADVPGSTGLGSSSAFTVGLLSALDRLVGVCPPDDQAELAQEACRIEMDDLHAPIGKQDQYVAAFGGLNLYRFLPDGTVTIAPIECDYDALSAHMLLLYTGQIRQGDAGETLAKQQQDRDDVRTLAIMALEFAASLRHGNLENCGGILHWAWEVKRKFCSDTTIEQWMNKAGQAGAWGGKLCGAGGGGFLCFLAPPERHAAITAATGLRRVPVRVGVKGSEVVYG